MTVLELPRTRVRPEPVTPVRARLRRPGDAGLLAFVTGLAYAFVGVVLVVRYDAVWEDALSRVSNAYYVLHSRQPKLSAVGFVWTPLPSLDFLPFLWLKELWPDLVRLGLLAVFQSAAATAFSVFTLVRLFEEMRLARGPRLALSAAFALHPVILIFAGNGMTESMMIAVLLVVVRRLLTWTRDGDSRHLVAAGVWLAVGYMVRYEFAAVGFAVVVLVAAVGSRRERGSGRPEVVVAADAALVGLPVFVTFLGWAATSWVIVGHPFDQFSSAYGNAALIAASQAGKAPRNLTPVFVLKQWLVLAPLLFPVLTAVGVRAARDRDPRVLVPLFVLGTVPVFELLVYLSGNLFGFLRYQLCVVPLLVVLVGLLLAPGDRAAAAARLRRPWARLARTCALTAVALALVLPAHVTATWAAMTRSDLAQQEYGHLRPVVMSLAGHQAASSTNGAWRADRVVADAVDRLDLAAGSVLVDSAPGFGVIVASQHAKQFVITSDSDFAEAVVDPVGHRIKYLLVCDRPAALDEVQRRWGAPLAAGTVPWAALVTQFKETSGVGHKWSLWKVAQPATPSTPGTPS